MRLLLVEDEPHLAEALSEYLRDQAYAVDHARSGREALELADVNTYDLLILDWNIPPPNGIELLQRWRREGMATPVLMLTAHGELDDRVSGLDSGADDYLTKPFQLAELGARVRSLLRRQYQQPEPMLQAGDVTLDRSRRQVAVAGELIELRPKEFAILEYLLLRQGRVVTRSELVEHVWDDSFDSFSNVVDVTVHRLRKKIDGDRPLALLHTLKGVGYVLKTERE